MIAHLDASSGISGDKFLSVLVDAGAELQEVQGALDLLGLDLTLQSSDVTRGGVRALAVRVEGPDDEPRRTWADIRVLISEAELPDTVASLALKAFSALAEVEGVVHGIEPEDVHFHEVGAVDAIGEIVGCAAAFSILGIERLTCSPVAVGSGTVECEHGTLPIPAPATALLLRDTSIEPGADRRELTTPTGAALLAAMCDSYERMPPMHLAEVGHGAGDIETSVPNVARLFLGRSVESALGPNASLPSNTAEENIFVLTANIDHLTGEQAAFVAENLREAGALDVWTTPVLMKKGRPGLVLEVMAAPAQASELASLLMHESGTLGVRISETPRLVADREIITVNTEWGAVDVKLGRLPQGVRARAEYEDCARIAREHGVSIERVASAAERAAIPEQEPEM